MERENRLGTQDTSKLLAQFAIPSVIAMLVSAFYNIVDQLFIGHSVGMLGNAATNVAFPLVTICIAIALMFGIGGAANFNLNMGSGKREVAREYVGNSFTLMIISGILLAVVVRIFLQPLLLIFGATGRIMPYAEVYTNITSIGFPFLILSMGGTALVRADGSPQYSMVITVIGAIINIILDYIFIFQFHMGMAGAAWATVIGQIVSALLVVQYMMKFKTVKLHREHFLPSFHISKKIMSLGMAPSFNQIALLFLQIVANNVIRKYGAESIYGAEIPLAVIGIAMKVNMIFFSMAIGIAQGMQPIVSYNYGARHFLRVKETFIKAVIAAMIVLFIAFLLFQFFPIQIIRLFGEGDEKYYAFAKKVFRILLFTTFLNGVQPVASNFLTSMGKAILGVFLSLTRQVLFFIPLAIILPYFMGLDGILYTAPIADVAAFAVGIFLAKREFQKMDLLEQNK